MPNPNPGRERVLLGLLHSVEQDGTRSQRNMATEFGVALGLINTCLRHCVRKGYVKVKRIPARRYAYFLTPKGMAEKSRLTVAHVSNSLSFFRQAREDCDKVLRTAEMRGWNRLALAGAGELAEIAFLCADARSAALVAILDTGCPKDSFRGLPVARDLEALPPFDAVIVTDMSNPQGTYDHLAARLDADRILPLDVLRISTPPARLAG
ncbi:MAG TPA: hypothetical protein VEM35_07265 [Rhizomicrobium sp.]|nr:hypothetical protein [Rhizomicrobium sp.]